MKVVFTTSGSDLSAPLDSRFGRAPKFVVFDTEAPTVAVLDNTQNLNAAQGAGIQAAENVVRAGAEAVVTGHCGPKAFKVLKAAGVKIYNTNLPTIAEALNAFLTGKLVEASDADVEGHW